MRTDRNGLYASAKATQAHYARLPTKITSEIAIEPELRSAPPVIREDKTLSWYVLATVPRGEIKAVRGLRALGYEAYTPVETRWVQHSRTTPRIKREVQHAIFCRYVFFGMRQDDSWLPLREKDAWRRSKLGIIGVTFPMKGQDDGAVSLLGRHPNRDVTPIPRLAERPRCFGPLLRRLGAGRSGRAGT